jgi:hypothetical protein
MTCVASGNLINISKLSRTLLFVIKKWKWSKDEYPKASHNFPGIKNFSYNFIKKNC